MTPTFTVDEQEEGEQTQVFSGLSPDEHIDRFLRLDAQIKELSYERRAHATALIEKATQERRSQKTVHLQAHSGERVQVEFKTDWECNSEELETAKELLKDEKFNELFKTTYTPRLKALKMFLNTGFTDEAWQVAKEIIIEHVKEVEKTPYVSTDKTKS